MSGSQLHTTVRQFRELLGAGQLVELSDAELLERFVSTRDESAFALLAERHGRLVWSVCRQILGHQQDAEDAYQASFLVLVRHAASIRRGQTVACWLYRVASRIAGKAAMDRIKRRRCEAAAPRGSGAQVVQELAWRELQAILHEELARLPEKYRAAFVICCLDGKSKSDAARQLGWKEGTVSSRLAHARKVLQLRLARRGVALAAVLCSAELLFGRRAPAALAKSTVKAASWLLAGRAITDLLSPSVIALIDGGIKAMCLSKTKSTLLAIFAVCLLGTSAGAVAWPQQSSKPSSQEAAAIVNNEDTKSIHREPAASATEKPPSQPWIGFASRETNAGPELSILFDDGTRQTYNAAADTVILSYLADYPLGGHESLSVDLADSNRVLLRFKLPHEGRVQKAELILSRSQSKHPYPTRPITLAFHEVKEPWDEGSTTWNRQPAVARRPGMTAEITPSSKEYRIDVTGLVRREIEGRAAPNGWLLRINTPLGPDRRTADGAPPPGWACMGNEYLYAVDSAIRRSGKYSCRIEARGARPASFAMMSQTIQANDYRGERVRFAGHVKTEGLQGNACLWMRVDGENELLGIDKTNEKAVRDTLDWQPLQIVLEVPQSSKTIRFAVLVEGTGKAWVDDLKLEVVDQNVPLTNTPMKSGKEKKQEIPRRPMNLDFEGIMER